MFWVFIKYQSRLTESSTWKSQRTLASYHDLDLLDQSEAGIGGCVAVAVAVALSSLLACVVYPHGFSACQTVQYPGDILGSLKIQDKRPMSATASRSREVDPLNHWSRTVGTPEKDRRDRRDNEGDRPFVMV